ncbi:hypothetical protein DWZ45_11785 [Clostridium sp. AF32-7AC]|nr:hypothetical protein DWZ45_11785 [Clostridium sp. AF32-7AC]RHQ64594.1 hypothetical protein DWY27_14340 [Clostridium sp. AF24-2LB]
MPDHIHLLLDCKPQFFISDMQKGKTWRKNHKIQPLTKMKHPHRREANGRTRRSFVISSVLFCCLLYSHGRW